MPASFARARFWPGIAAVILITSTLLPPAAGYAREYVFAQALQFVTLAVAGPALLALAIPWRARPVWLHRDARPGRPVARAAIRLIAFVTVAATWRLPVTVSALVRDPALVAAEVITLLAAGTGIWAELVGPQPASRRLPPPARAAMAAAATWTIWVLAYLTGMSGRSWFAAYHGAPGGLSAAADQQIATAILWAVPAACFLPVLFVTVIAWLAGGTGVAGDPRPAASASPSGSLPLPPRGWRSPSTR